MFSAAHLSSRRRTSNETRTYATDDDFQQLFAREIADFYQLSLQLTADAEKAGHCLILARRDCFGRSNISRNVAPVWARRMIIRSAIRLVLDIDNAIDTKSEFYLQPNEYRIEKLRESAEVLDLPHFDRLVFVICVLERLFDPGLRAAVEEIAQGCARCNRARHQSCCLGRKIRTTNHEMHD